MTTEPSDLAAAAAEKLNPSEPEAPRKRGRPKGSKNKSSASTQSQSTDTSGQDSKESFVYTKDEGSIAATKILGMTVWGMASLMLPVRPLTDPEGDKLAEALDPVLQKWIPIVGEWKHELGLLMVLLTLVAATKIEPEKSDSDSTAEVIE